MRTAGRNPAGAAARQANKPAGRGPVAAGHPDVARTADFCTGPAVLFCKIVYTRQDKEAPDETAHRH